MYMRVVSLASGISISFGQSEGGAIKLGLVKLITCSNIHLANVHTKMYLHGCQVDAWKSCTCTNVRTHAKYHLWYMYVAYTYVLGLGHAFG